MPINPNIPLASRTANLSGLGNSLLQGQTFKDRKDNAPVQNKLLEQRAQMQERSIANSDSQRQLEAAVYAHEAATSMLSIPEENMEQRQRANAAFRGQMQALGYEVGEDDDDLTNAGLEAIVQATAPMYKMSRMSIGGVDAQNFEARMKAAGIEPGTSEYQRAARIAAGLDPRAGMSAQERIAGDPSLTNAVAGSEATIAGRKAGATATATNVADLATKPPVAAAVAAATAGATGATSDRVAIEQLNRDNKDLLGIWESGLGSLGESLGNTWQGPIKGLSPAFTTEQQIADGALATMAPMLKSLFRESGEGTFTKDDQEILMAMLPTRKDTPEAAAAKMELVDTLVRLKLAPKSPIASDARQATTAATATGPNGEKLILRNGQWVTQ